MSPWPSFASNRPFGSAALPNVGGALISLFRPIVLQKIVKTIIAHQGIEEAVEINTVGVLQPLTDVQLNLLPEGQRAWSNEWLHCHPNVRLTVDDRVVIGTKGYRVMAFKDYSAYGYMEYHLLQDFIGSEPKVVV